MLNSSGKCRSQDVPQQSASVPQQGVSVLQQDTGIEDEPFAFKLVPSTLLSVSTIRPSSMQPTPLDSLSSIMEKLESFAGAVAGIEVWMLCRFNSLEAKIAALQHVTTVNTTTSSFFNS